MDAQYACPYHSLLAGESLVYFKGDNINAKDASKVASKNTVAIYALPLINKAGMEWVKALIMSL